MLIFIKTLTGKTVSIDVETTETIATIKSKIKDRENVPVAQQRLLFAGKELTDEKTADGCGIKKETILHLVLKKSAENMQHLSTFEKGELMEAQSAKMSKFYNASAGLHDEVRKYQDSESKWDQHQNPSGATFDLGKDGEFKEYTVLIGQHYTSFDISNCRNALLKKGFSVIVTTDEQDFLNNLEKADVAWIISNQGFNRQEFNQRPMPYVEQIMKYHRRHGGLMIFGDNSPYFAHANALLRNMFKDTQCTGCDPGNTVLKIGSQNKTGHFGTHLLSSGIITLFEGITICSTDSKATPLKTLATNSSGRPAIQFADHEILPDKNYGRVVLDHGFTKLFYSWDEAGTARYVCNATVWLLALEHRTRIGVPITARCKTEDPTMKETLFRTAMAVEHDFTAKSVAELVEKLPRMTTKENPVKITFCIAGKLPKLLKDVKSGVNLEWSKSKDTNQRRPMSELEEWAVTKKSGHFYLYLSGKSVANGVGIRIL